MATTRQNLPPQFQIAKSATGMLQATDAMAAWMTLINKQAAAALVNVPPLPANVVTVAPSTDGGTTPPPPDNVLPENLILVGAAGDNSSVAPIPDPGQPDQVLVSGGAGQRPRWTHLAAITPSLVMPLQLVALHDAQQVPTPPPLSEEQQQIINHIAFLLQELIRATTKG